MFKRALLTVVFIFPLLIATRTHAAAGFEVSGWIPYWRIATGTQDALNHIDTFKELNPFGYTVKSDGSLNDPIGFGQAPWPDFQKLTTLKGIRFIPTIMWSDAESIHRVLSSPALRKAHIKAIVTEVNARGFDGIDIDYEAKYAKTQPYFSLFLKELYTAMGKKWVTCAIEARTPSDSRRNPEPDNPKDYANDYKTIAKYCDRVKIMTYDQASVDRKLTSVADGPYIPVSDPKWVEKVIVNAAKDIPKRKLMIGVATYGYEYKVTPITGGYDYRLQWAFNPKYALDLATTLGITPQRNVAGELSFIYRPNDETASVSPNSASAITGIANAAAVSLSQSFNMVWWSDAQAIADKVALAKKLGVRGVAIFKIDGGEDPNIWTVLP